MGMMGVVGWITVAVSASGSSVGFCGASPQLLPASTNATALARYVTLFVFVDMCEASYGPWVALP